MDDNIIKIKRRGASLNLFKIDTDITNAKPSTDLKNPPNIKLLNYQDLLDHVKIAASFNGKYFIYNFDSNGLKVSLYMKSINSIGDYLFRYHNDTDVNCKQDNKNTNSKIKNCH
jgi:hypothetical protein